MVVCVGWQTPGSPRFQEGKCKQAKLPDVRGALVVRRLGSLVSCRFRFLAGSGSFSLPLWAVHIPRPWVREAFSFTPHPTGFLPLVQGRGFWTKGRGGYRAETQGHPLPYCLFLRINNFVWNGRK